MERPASNVQAVSAPVLSSPFITSIEPKITMSTVDSWPNSAAFSRTQATSISRRADAAMYRALIPV
ncbi:hypothetical protein D3C85_1874760 [compost metagenome]